MADWSQKTRGWPGIYVHLANKHILLTVEESTDGEFISIAHMQAQSPPYVTQALAKERLLRNFKKWLAQAKAETDELLKEFGG